MAQRWRAMAAGLLVATILPLGAKAQSALESDWQDIDLLKGRLVISAPPGTQIVPNEAANIMAAAPSEEMATKLNVPLGQTENDIVVYANEHFALFPQAPETYFGENHLGGILEDRNAPPRSEQFASGLRAYGAFEGKRRHASGNYVLANILVAQADGTTQEIFIMTWNERAQTLERYSDIASRMIASLRPGPRQRLETGGRHVIEASSRDGRTLRFALSLPASHIFSEQRGPDFTVYRIEKLAPLDAAAGGLGIYIGWHPNMSHQRKGIPAAKLMRVATRIVDHRSEWVQYQEKDADGGPDWIHREAIVPLEGDRGLGAKMHLFMAAPEGSGEIDALTRLIETQMVRVQP